MKIVTSLFVLTFGLTFVACSGKSDNKNENIGKIIDKPESACDCAKNAVIAVEDLIDDLEKKDDLSRSEYKRIIMDWREKNEDSGWNKICENKYKDVEIEDIKNCEASEQLIRLQKKLKKIDRQFSEKDEPREEESKGEGYGGEESKGEAYGGEAYGGEGYGGEAYGGGAYDGSEYEGSEYEGPSDAPDGYEGE